MIEKTEGKGAILKKQLTLGRALAFILPTLLVTSILTTQLCYRFMYLPAVRESQRQLAQLTAQYEEKDALLKELESIHGLFEKNYVGSLEKQALVDGVMKAYIEKTGDRFAAYYSPEEYAALEASLHSEGVGVGMRVSNTSNGRLIVAHVEKDGPAQKAGVKARDEILSVDGQRVSKIGAEKALALLAGAEGSEAVFSVYDGESEREVSVTRQKMNYATVHYDLEEDTGYLLILSFASTTPKELEKAVKELQEQGAARLIFDLRRNSGGLLSSVHDALDLLIADGSKEEPKVVVTTIDKNQNETRYLCDDGKSVDLPMAVLVDKGTASAAELFAAALRDYELGVIVGETTYGKGVAQSTYKLESGGAVRLTTAKYYPPSGQGYDGIGVVPHKEVKSDNVNLFLTPHGEDPVYQAALEELTS